jgi:hypothetical protein
MLETLTAPLLNASAGRYNLTNLFHCPFCFSLYIMWHSVSYHLPNLLWLSSSMNVCNFKHKINLVGWFNMTAVGTEYYFKWTVIVSQKHVLYYVRINSGNLISLCVGTVAHTKLKKFNLLILMFCMFVYDIRGRSDWSRQILCTPSHVVLWEYDHFYIHILIAFKFT